MLVIQILIVTWLRSKYQVFFLLCLITCVLGKTVGELAFIGIS